MRNDARVMCKVLQVFVSKSGVHPDLAAGVVGCSKLILESEMQRRRPTKVHSRQHIVPPGGAARWQSK